MLVMKFGGTSVGSVEAFAQVVTIVTNKVAEQTRTTTTRLLRTRSRCRRPRMSAATCTLRTSRRCGSPRSYPSP